MKPIASAITGSLNPERKESSSTGQPPGETGSGVQPQPLGAPPAKIPVPGDMHPEIMIRSSRENSEALRSRLKSFGVELSVRKETRWKTDPVTGQSDMRFVTVGVSLSRSAASSLSDAKRIMGEAMAPANRDMIEGWLGELALLTKHQFRDTVSVRGVVVAYVDRLRAYPGDIVREILTSWRDEWFPAWPKLKEKLDEMSLERSLMARRLEQEP